MFDANTRADVLVGIKLGRSVSGAHSCSKCMYKGCNAAPEIECIWADGRGRAWHCGKHHKEWSTQNEGLPKDIVKEHRIPNGVVGEKYGEYPKTKKASLENTLRSKVDKYLKNPSVEEATSLNSWFRKTFPKVFMSRTPRGQKRLKEDTEFFAKGLELAGWEPHGESPGSPEWERLVKARAEEVRSRWDRIKDGVDALVAYFSTESSKGAEVPAETKVGSNVYKNMAGLTADKFSKYVGEMEKIWSSLKGWHKKALKGGITVGFAGPRDFRGTSSGTYRTEKDTLLVRATPKVLARSSGYGSPHYVLVHELGHRFERYNSLPTNFDRPEWYTTRYSFNEGESFAELFALSHYNLKGNWDPDKVTKFERLMSGKKASTHLADAKDGKTTGYRDSVGLFIRLPEHLAEQFPSLAPEDNSPPHVTFLFVGDMPEEKDELFLETVHKVFSQGLPVIKAKLDGIDFFDHPDKVRRVAHVPVRFSTSLAEIRTRLASALEDAGIKVKDSFPVYRPHTTLAYMDGVDSTYSGPVPTGEWEFDEIDIWGLPQEHKVSFRRGAKAAFNAESILDLMNTMSEGRETSKTAFVAEDDYDQGGNHRVILWPDNENEFQFLNKTIRGAFDDKEYFTQLVVRPRSHGEDLPPGIGVHGDLDPSYVRTGRLNPGTLLNSFLRKKEAAYFNIGDEILFGKYKNKRGRIVTFGKDEKGNPTIEVEPIPKGRKKNKVMTVFKVWHADPEKRDPDKEATDGDPMSRGTEVWVGPMTSGPKYLEGVVVEADPGPDGSATVRMDTGELDRTDKDSVHPKSLHKDITKEMDAKKARCFIRTAGWWAIKPGSPGGVPPPVPKGGLTNAVPGVDPADQMYSGDMPADIMGNAFSDIDMEYRREWGRPAKPEELQAVFDFVFGGLETRLEEGKKENEWISAAADVLDVDQKDLLRLDSDSVKKIRSMWRGKWESGDNLDDDREEANQRFVGALKTLRGYVRALIDAAKQRDEISWDDRTRLVDLFLKKGRLDPGKIAARYKDKHEDKDGNVHYEYSERQVQHRNREKARRIEGLKTSIPKLRKKVEKDLTSSDPKTKMTALAVALIDETYERVGNDESAAEGRYGVTGWTADHVSFGGKGATISYVGKSGVKQKKIIGSPKVVSALKEAVAGCDDKSGKVLSYDDGACVSSSDVNDYLSHFDITAKDIRGYHANDEMLSKLRAIRDKGPPIPNDKKERDGLLKKEFDEALKQTSEAVGHEAKTLDKDYLVPGLRDSYTKDGTVIESFLKSAAEAVTDTASFYVIAPEALHKVIENGAWEQLANKLWNEHETPEGVFNRMEDIVRRMGGAVLYTGMDGGFDVDVLGKYDDEGRIVKIDLPMEGKGALPPYGVGSVVATKDQNEKEEDAARKLQRREPKKKPPRDDLRKHRVDTDSDPDLKRPNATNDPDLSLNYKKVALLYAVGRRGRKRLKKKKESGKASSPEGAKKLFEEYRKTKPGTKKTWKDFYVEPAEAPEPEEAPEEEAAPEKPPTKKAPPTAEEDKRGTWWESPTNPGYWVAQDQKGDTRAFDNEESAKAFAKGQKAPKGKKPKKEPDEAKEPEAKKEPEPKEEPPKDPKKEIAEQISSAGLSKDVGTSLQKRLETMSEADQRAVSDSFKKTMDDNVGKQLSPEESEALMKELDSKELPEDPAELGAALARRSYAQKVVSDPTMLGGQPVSNVKKNDAELQKRGMQALEQYMDLSPDRRIDASKKIVKRLKDLDKDSHEAKELNVILDGIATASALNGHAVEGRPSPSSLFTNMAKGLERKGELQMLFAAADPGSGAGRRAIMEGLSVLDDDELIEATAGTELMDVFAERLKDPKLSKKRKAEIRRMMMNSVHDDLAFIDPMVQDVVRETEGKDAASNQKRREEVRKEIHKSSAQAITPEMLDSPELEEATRMGLIESAVRWMDSKARDVKSMAGGMLRAVVKERNPEILHQRTKTPVTTPSSDTKPPRKPKKKQGGQSVPYIEDPMSEGPGFPRSRQFPEPETPRQIRRITMSKFLTPKGAEEIQDHINRLAHIAQHDWQALGIPTEAHGIDLAHRLDIFGDTVARKARENVEKIKQAQAAVPAPTVGEGTISDDEGNKLRGGQPADDNKQTVPNGYDPSDIGKIKPPERQEADEPYVDAFTQDEFHQLSDIQESGEFSNAKAAKEELAKIGKSLIAVAEAL